MNTFPKSNITVCVMLHKLSFYASILLDWEWAMLQMNKSYNIYGTTKSISLDVLVILHHNAKHLSSSLIRNLFATRNGIPKKVSRMTAINQDTY